MIAVLIAPAVDKIYIHISTGISFSITGCIALLIVQKIDTLINKMMVKKSTSIFLINMLFSFLVTALIFALVTWLLNVVLRSQWTLDFRYLKDQIVIINFLAIIILAYYTISYFTRAIARKNEKLSSENQELSRVLNRYLTRIPSLANKKTVLLPITQISYFQIEEGVVFAHTVDGKKHPLTITTLNELESKLNPAAFYRINRSEIVHIDKIASYEPYFKDRLAIKLINSDSTLYTSNSKSASFKEWLISPNSGPVV